MELSRLANDSSVTRQQEALELQGCSISRAKLVVNLQAKTCPIHFDRSSRRLMDCVLVEVWLESAEHSEQKLQKTTLKQKFEVT